ncbi:MAG: DUF934 domain-containing protein [Candidatus Competibacteraceae bacterium]
MRRVIKNRRIIEDHWRELADDEALPLQGAIIVSPARWRRERQALLARPDKQLGIRLKNDMPVADIAEDLPYMATIALEFPSFKDGRALTQARLLRERHGYRGELRAVGDVLRDQLFFMQRCGFDTFEPRSDQNLEDLLEAFGEFTVTYQPAADEPLPLYRRGR